MSLFRLLISTCLLACLSACASTPGLPETTYYRLPQSAAQSALPEPAVALPIVVETFLADGLHSNQALVYSLDADAHRLRTYHYQLWSDPPGRLLQRRLIADLRTIGLSRIVTDRLPVHMEALRISGRIARLERVRTAAGWDVAVSLVLRAEPTRGGRPWVIGEYHRQLPAQGDSMTDTINRFGQALDEITAEFIADLIRHTPAPSAADSDA